MLVWPGGDKPPFLARIDGQAWDGMQAVAHLQGPRGPLWATHRVLSSAQPVLKALAEGQKVGWAHC